MYIMYMYWKHPKYENKASLKNILVGGFMPQKIP